MIFDLEDEGSERMVSASNPLLSLNEPSHIPLRLSRTRAAGVGLPSSFSSLRPASLPTPGAAKPLRDLATAEDTSQPVRTSQSHTRQTTSPDKASSKDPEPSDPREAEILKLVAADTPSHRGAWRKDSKAWQLFVRRQGGKALQSGGLIPEETEDDSFAKYADDDSDGDSDLDDQRGKYETYQILPHISRVAPLLDSGWNPYKHADIAASLPISIGPLSPIKETLSLASYQPKASLSDRLVPAPPARSKFGSRQVTSAALRKAAYAQRDLHRYADPGPLDFAADDDDEDDDEDEEEATLATTDKGGRARQHALKILQVRSEVPASGMWRSLA